MLTTVTLRRSIHITLCAPSFATAYQCVACAAHPANSTRPPQKHGREEGRNLECEGEDMRCFALVHPDLLQSACHGKLTRCDWTQLLMHYSVAQKKPDKYFSCKRPASECYAMQNPDLLAAYCEGDVSRCDWRELVTHWAQSGSKEGRIFGCKPPPPPPNPRPSPKPSHHLAARPPPLLHKPHSPLPPSPRSASKQLPPPPPPPPPPPKPTAREQIALPKNEVGSASSTGHLVLLLELSVLATIVLIFVLAGRQIYRIAQGAHQERHAGAGASHLAC